MKTWTSALALIAAGTMLVGSAFAQTSAPSGSTDSTKSSDKTKSSDSMKSSDTKSDAAKGDKSAAKHGRSHDMAGGGNAEQVKAVQQALKDAGHDPGDIDGKMGPKTQAALRDYQSKEGLKATGRMDSETLAKLGVETKSSAADTSGSAGSASPSSSAPSSSASGASSGAKK